jgi:mRNA interferase HigB
MNVVARRTLVQFWEKNPRSKQALEAWYHETAKAHWTRPEDVKRQHPGASILGNNRVQFDIRGNEFRLVCAVRYDIGWLWVKFVGTHAEYDRIDAETYNGNPT